MLTDLTWLEGEFPPRSERPRLERYRQHAALFETDHTREWESLFADLARLYRKSDPRVMTALNYHQLLSKKTADFVCGEPPDVSCPNDPDRLSRLLGENDWFQRLYEGIIDVTRYGNAVFKVRGKRLTQVPPLYWYPIVDPKDLKSIQQHVIAYGVAPDASGDPTQLFVEIHTPGRVEQRTYALVRGQIGKLVSKPLVESTGLEDFAVQVLTNLTHSGSLYGMDDYRIINGLVAEIMWRLHCAGTVLNKHSEPSMSGPSSALTWDERLKTYYLDLGNYFKREQDTDPEPKYITWDGNLEAAWKEIELLTEQLYILTEMGQAFMEGGTSGGASSGTALKLRLVSPRIKAARLTSINEAAVKRIISLLAAANNYDPGPLSIVWQDGLPDDEQEELQSLILATGGKPVMSQTRALRSQGLTDPEVEEELENLRREEASRTSLNLGIFDSLGGSGVSE